MPTFCHLCTYLSLLCIMQASLTGASATLPGWVPDWVQECDNITVLREESGSVQFTEDSPETLHYCWEMPCEGGDVLLKKLSFSAVNGNSSFIIVELHNPDEGAFYAAHRAGWSHYYDHWRPGPLFIRFSPFPGESTSIDFTYVCKTVTQEPSTSTPAPPTLIPTVAPTVAPTNVPPTNAPPTVVPTPEPSTVSPTIAIDNSSAPTPVPTAALHPMPCFNAKTCQGYGDASARCEQSSCVCSGGYASSAAHALVCADAATRAAVVVSVSFRAACGAVAGQVAQAVQDTVGGTVASSVHEECSAAAQVVSYVVHMAEVPVLEAAGLDLAHRFASYLTDVDVLAAHFVASPINCTAPSAEAAILVDGRCVSLLCSPDSELVNGACVGSAGDPSADSSGSGDDFPVGLVVGLAVGVAVLIVILIVVVIVAVVYMRSKTPVSFQSAPPPLPLSEGTHPTNGCDV